jgi:hypothetical protein
MVFDLDNQDHGDIHGIYHDNVTILCTKVHLGIS